MSEGIKHDQGKPRASLLCSKWLNGVMRVLGFGARKYSDHNYRKGMAWSRYYDAVQRHLIAWNDGEDTDPESGENHLLHASCCLMMLHEMTVLHPKLDDRYRAQVALTLDDIKRMAAVSYTELVQDCLCDYTADVDCDEHPKK